MGLDMYLRAKLYVSDYLGRDDMPAVKQIVDELGMPQGNSFFSAEIVTTAVYWRKANQIHKWFVDNVQGGTDDCGNYYVDKDKLTELRELCASLSASKDVVEAREKLPPQSGFFFGPTDIDQYYWEDLTGTVEAIDKLFANPKIDSLEFEYHSSW